MLGTRGSCPFLLTLFRFICSLANLCRAQNQRFSLRVPPSKPKGRNGLVPEVIAVHCGMGYMQGGEQVVK